MGDTWWVIIICPCVNVFSLMGGVTEADVGFPTVNHTFVTFPRNIRLQLWSDHDIAGPYRINSISIKRKLDIKKNYDLSLDN
jgi:hypothetical protein